jgi:heme a synthase
VRLVAPCSKAIWRDPMDSALSHSAAKTGSASPERPLAISNWLLAVASLVFLMVVVGGITRLTESGLSITEWKPVTGAVPPLSHAAWQHAFDLYRRTPEYLEINGPAGMTLAQFKFIFFWEWLHRLLGRLIGIAFALPLLWFAAKRAIPQGYGWKLFGLLVLGGVQGALGWYMVMSGLVDRTDVSHFRLSAHLLLAFAIMSALIWVALDLRQVARTGEIGQRVSRAPPSRRSVSWRSNCFSAHGLPGSMPAKSRAIGRPCRAVSSPRAWTGRMARSSRSHTILT